VKVNVGRQRGPGQRTRLRWLAPAGAALALLLVAVALIASGCGSSSSGSSSSASASSAPASGPFTNLTPWTVKAAYVMPNGTKVSTNYAPITKVSKSWKLAVLFPDVFDAYWTATNYGIVQEAKRDHASMQLFDAGGYGNLSTQVTQLGTAIAQGYNAIIIGAISSTGLNAEIDQAVAKGIPVIDVINGINDPKCSGHALVSFNQLATITAKYIVQHSNGQPVNVGFFPGPAGAGWSDDAVKGFMDTIKGTSVKVVVMRRTDTAQTALLPAEQDAVTAYPQMNCIVGVDSAGQTGATVVQQANKQGKIQVYAFDQIIPVWSDIVAGTINGSPTDYTAIQGRMAVDEAVRLLEGQTLTPSNDVGPVPEMVTKANAQTLNYADMMGAKGWKIQFSVKP
jgi:protein TorT